MKHITLTFVIMLMIVIACSPRNNPLVDISDEDTYNKLDPRMKFRIAQVENTMISAFIRTKTELTEDEVEILKTHGVIIMSSIRHVYVVTIPFRSIFAIAKETFVVHIEAPKGITNATIP